METPNVNNLNGIPNFGHGLPEDGEVIAGVTDVGPESVVETPIEEAPIEAPVEMPVEEAPVTE